MFYQILLSPKLKRWAIITYKNGIYLFIYFIYSLYLTLVYKIVEHNSTNKY